FQFWCFLSHRAPCLRPTPRNLCFRSFPGAALIRSFCKGQRRGVAHMTSSTKATVKGSAMSSWTTRIAAPRCNRGTMPRTRMGPNPVFMLRYAYLASAALLLSNTFAFAQPGRLVEGYLKRDVKVFDGTETLRSGQRISCNLTS